MKWRDFTDWIWPTLEQLPCDYAERQRVRLDIEIAQQVAACASKQDARAWCEHALEDYKREQSRGEQAKSFLLAMFVAAPMATAGLVGLATWLAPDKLPSLRHSLYVLIAIGAFAILQLLRVLASAIKGLSSRAHESVPHPPIQPQESEEDYARRKAAAIVRATAFNTEQNNDYVSAKNLVLVCWRNFGAALVLLLVGVVIVLIYNSVATHASNGNDSSPKLDSLAVQPQGFVGAL